MNRNGKSENEWNGRVVRKKCILKDKEFDDSSSTKKAPNLLMLRLFRRKMISVIK
jgi:hypothetical protein